jgi:molybdopterin-guanine dinucleotide biosynthesis protein A
VIADCTALVLAGGKSRRMGQDKAQLVVADATLLQRVVAIVRPLFANVVVSVDKLRPEIGLPQVCDEHENAGPLAGLAAGLAHATTPWVFAIATDMPFARPTVIEALAQRRNDFDAVIPVAGGHAQPLLGLYSRTCLPAIRNLLASEGRRSLHALLEQLNVCYVDESEMRMSDPELASFFDLDTPEDLALAKQRQPFSMKEKS